MVISIGGHITIIVGFRMQKILGLLILSLIISSCGKTNVVKTVGATPTIENLETINPNFSKFEGTYDLIQMRLGDCGASIQIVRECSGLKLTSNNTGPEDFCNINKSGSAEGIINTIEGNTLKSVVSLSAEIKFTKTLTIRNNGVLEKVSQLKGRNSHCLYQKR